MGRSQKAMAISRQEGEIRRCEERIERGGLCEVQKLSCCILILQRICFLHISSSSLYQGKIGEYLSYMRMNTEVCSSPKRRFLFSKCSLDRIKIIYILLQMLKGLNKLTKQLFQINSIWKISPYFFKMSLQALCINGRSRFI